MKVYAFIVTYNRLDSLKRVLSCLKGQTYPIDKILVVNNDSTDGTREWLDSVDDISVLHQDNVGGAGGFHTGVKWCYEQGADWIWMMDDDVYPQLDCLSHLMRYTTIAGSMNITRYWADGGYVPQLFHFDINTNSCIERECDLGKEYETQNTCCFEGFFISREIVCKIGYPDKRFFIAGDDTIYGYLASLHAPEILVRDAIAIRQQKNVKAKARPFYLYYTTRNRHLMSEYKKKITGNGYSLKTNLVKFNYTIRGLIKYLCVREWLACKAIMWGWIDSCKKKTGSSYHC